MKKHIFTVGIIMALLLMTITPSMSGAKVYAQEPVCTDVAGGVIPCPPTEDTGDGGSDDGGGNSGGNQNPPSSVATPTNTPLPLTNLNDGSTEAKWSGSCSGTHSEIVLCVGKLAASCDSSKGSYDIEIKDGVHTLTCTLPAVLEPTPFPLSSAPEEDLIGTCSAAEGNVHECLDELQRQCEDGLLVIKVDLYATGGTSYKVYCIPHEDVPQFDFPIAIPDDGVTEDNWTGGCEGGPGLDACLDIYSGLCSEEGGDFSVWYDDEGGAGVHCENQSDASQPAPTEPIDIAALAEDGETEGSWDEECGYWTCWISALACFADGGKGYEIEDSVGNHGYHCDTPSSSGNAMPPGGSLPFGLGALIGVFAAVAIPAFMKNARKAKTAEAVTNVKKMYDGARVADGGEADGSTGAPQPKPAPKPTPPPKPKSPPGDFDSDGDVDHRDF